MKPLTGNIARPTAEAEATIDRAIQMVLANLTANTPGGTFANPVEAICDAIDRAAGTIGDAIREAAVMRPLQTGQD